MGTQIDLDKCRRPDVKYPAFTHKLIWYPLSKFLTPFFLRINVSANNVSVLKFLVFILAGMLYLGGTWKWFVLGSVILIMAHVLDNVDGMIARVTGTMSERGRWIDNITEDIGGIFVVIGLMFGLCKIYPWLLITTIGILIILFKLKLGAVGKQETAPKTTVFSSPLPFRIYWTVKTVPVLLLVTGLFNVIVVGFVLMTVYHGIRLFSEMVRRSLGCQK